MASIQKRVFSDKRMILYYIFTLDLSDSCDPNPCLNGGSCFIGSKDPSLFLCACTDGRERKSGDTCAKAGLGQLENKVLLSLCYSGTDCILLHLYELFIGGSMENKTLAGEEFSKPLKPVMLAPEWRQDNDSELSKETKRLEEVYSMELDPKDVEKTAKFATTR